jgi:fructose-specific phosphotransferase system IIA component
MDVNFSELLSPECIDLDLKGKKKREIIGEMVNLLAKNENILYGKDIIEELMSREKETSTGIGKGVAIPHKLMRGIRASIICFGRSKHPVNFDAIDGKQVDLFFLLLGPEGSTNTHLRILSKLSRYVHNDTFLAALRQAKTAEEVVSIFSREEVI